MNDTTDPTPTKHCPKCDETKSATSEYFGIDKTRKDGLDGHCKACRKEYRVQNREHLIAVAAKWNRDNPKRFAEHVRNSERKDPQKTADRQHLWYSTNKDKSRTKTLRRIARKRGAPGTHTAEDILRQYEKQGGKCAYCQCEVGQKYHVDHILALCNGGSNGPENLVITCPSCNSKKTSKLLYTEWVPSNPLPGIV